MRLLSFVAAASLAFCSQARADTLQYTVYYQFSIGSYTTIFDLSSQPTPTYSDANKFLINDVPVLFNGTPEITEVGFALFNGLYELGIGDNLQLVSNDIEGYPFYGAAFGVASSPYFTGSTTAPTLKSGQLYDLIANSNVTVLDVTATPEPSSIALLGTGMLGIAGVVRKRFAA